MAVATGPRTTCCCTPTVIDSCITRNASSLNSRVYTFSGGIEVLDVDNGAGGSVG